MTGGAGGSAETRAAQQVAALHPVLLLRHVGPAQRALETLVVEALPAAQRDLLQHNTALLYTVLQPTLPDAMALPQPPHCSSSSSSASSTTEL